MSDAEITEIGTDELDWDEAVVGEARKPGSVVSVRLDGDETQLLRELADKHQLNVSQVLRRALQEFALEDAAKRATGQRHLVRAFTYGGHLPMIYGPTSFYSWVVTQQLPIPGEVRRSPVNPPPTTTEPTRISELVVI